MQKAGDDPWDDFLSPVVFLCVFPKFEIGKSWEDNGMTLISLSE